MDKIELNELPSWSVWPSRLLSLAPWDMVFRTPNKVIREYDFDKYDACLRICLESTETVTPEDIKRFELGRAFQDQLAVSVGDLLYKMPIQEARTRHYQMILERIVPYGGLCSSIVELGCGYGYNLWLLSKKGVAASLAGGEFSEKAVRIAQRLYALNSQIKVYPFNFYDRESYRILESLPPPVVVFTVHAIEQLPQADIVLEALEQYKDIISMVLHFEPIYEVHSKTLLGLMRRRYAEVNDYNRNLLTVLERSPTVQILEQKVDIFGLNPLNPTSILGWSFSH